MESKSRMVSFRLSETEYAGIEEASRAHGYRSISLFARCAILAYHSASPQSNYEEQLSELRERMETMAAELIRISAHVRVASNGDCPACGNGAHALEAAASK